MKRSSITSDVVLKTQSPVPSLNQQNVMGRDRVLEQTLRSYSQRLVDFWGGELVKVVGAAVPLPQVVPILQNESAFNNFLQTVL